MEFLNKYAGVLATIAIVIAIGVYVSKDSNLGGGTRFPNGISADSTSPSAGQVRGTTLTTTGAATLGGNLTVTTSNSATSTLTVGCMQFYATSTATPWRTAIIALSTSTAIAGGGTADGYVVAQYGSCPR